MKNWGTCIPVSYTHLDVYKRQVVRTATTIRTIIVAVRGAIVAIRRTAVVATFAI